MLVKFKIVCTRNLYIDFLAKFALRAVAIADARSANPHTELFVSTRFRSAICAPDLRQPYYPTLYRRAPLRFFLAFFASLRTHLRFFPARAPRLNPVASLTQPVAAMSRHAPRRRIFARFLLAVVRGYFQNFTQNSDEPAPTFAPPS